MSQPTQEQIERLPKWAQDHIDRLQRQLDAARADRQAATESSPSNVQWAYGVGDVTKYIPDYARVEFRLTKHDSITVRLREDGKSVEVHTSRGAILVRPQAANVVRVVPEDLSERF